MLESSMEIQGDILALRESSMELHINTRGYILWESSMETHIHTRGYTSFVGDQHGNTQALWEFSMETHIHPSQLALLSLLDMSAAFDTVEHNMLIQRLSHSFGIKGRALSWRESYINERTQSVHLSREKTPLTPVTCGATGVPQGTVLAAPSKSNRETSAHKKKLSARTKLITRQRTLSPWSDGCMDNNYA